MQAPALTNTANDPPRTTSPLFTHGWDSHLMTEQTVVDDVLKAADDVRARLPEPHEPARGFTVFDSLDDAMRKHLLELAKKTV